MAASESLGTLYLAARCSRGDTEVLVDSISGLRPGSCVYFDGELMQITGFGVSTAIGNALKVRRGVEGTATHDHAAATPGAYGRGDQFHDRNPPAMTAPDEPRVNPWINVKDGRVFVLDGNALGNGRHFWKEVYWQHFKDWFGSDQIVVRDWDTDNSYIDADGDGT